MGPSEPISARYRLTEADFMAASNASWSAMRQGARPNLAVGGAAIVFGLVMVAFFSRWVGVTALVIGALVVAMVGLRSVLWRRAFRKMRKYEHEVRFEFSEGGIYSATSEGDATLEWGFYRWFLDTRDYLLLYVDKRSFTVIPKRSLADPAEFERLLELVKAKLTVIP